MRSYKTPLVVSVILFGFQAHALTTAPTPSLEPLRLETRYDGSFSGLPLGRVRITFNENKADYHLRLDTKSRGIASLFSSMKSVAEVGGIVDANQRYIHQRYTSKLNIRPLTGIAPS